MSPDPFERIPDVPLRRPVVPSPVGGLEPTKLVPTYALEEAGAGGQGPPGTDGSNGEGAAISVVGSDGLLNLVPKHSTWATPTDYPTELLTGDYSGGTGDYSSMVPTGFTTHEAATGDYAQLLINLIRVVSGASLTSMTPTLVKAENAATHAAMGVGGFEAVDDGGTDNVTLDFVGGLIVNIGGVQVTISGAGIIVDNGTNTLTVNPSLITADMTVREIDVCDGGVTKQMLIVASAPY